MKYLSVFLLALAFGELLNLTLMILVIIADL